MLRILGAVLVAAAVATGSIVVRSAHRDARAAPVHATGAVAATATPLWSPRRIPAIVTAAAAHQHEAADIARFAAPGRCIAVDGPAGALARDRAGLPLAPASTEKLLIAAAALRVLGPDHVFTTALETTAPVSGGVLHGDLFLVGGGDPVLASPGFRQRLASKPTTASEPTTALDDLAAALASAGVTRIAGSLLVDDHRYDTVRYPPALKPSERGVDLGPLGALSVDDGFGVNGVAAADPALLTAGSLTSLLRTRGITVAGPTRHATAPRGARTLAAVHSPRLDTIVASMLTVSDNYTAEMLVRAVGLALARRGSTADGLRAVVATLARLRVPTAGVSLVDGSGLSPDDRVTCDALLSAVELGGRDPALRALRAGLPIAGRTGTLAERFVGDPLAGRLRAKTGHIDGVDGLAGVVPSAAGLMSFALLANGDFPVSEADRVLDQIAHVIARYPGVPAARRLVPAPTA